MLALKKRQETTLAVFLALGVSFLLWIVAENASLFKADIAGPVIEFDESSDIITYVSEGKVRVLAGKSISEVRSLSMIIAFDPETVKISAESLTSSLGKGFALGDDGYATIVLDGMTTLTQGQELVTISIEGDVQDIVLSDVVITFDDGTTESLAVSTL